jgi:hypothetical protein
MTRNTPGERWYRRLLRLYPKDFRDEFGGEMTRLYRDRGREEPWWSLWCSLVVDLVRTAPSEHLSILRQDLRQAGRGLRRTPVITAMAVLTLALGVGASTAVYSVVHAVLLRPLPYPEADRLVEVFEEDRKAGAGFRVSALNYLSWTERSESFDAIGAFGSTGLTLTDAGDPDLLRGSLVTASLFRVLRVPPIVGRTLQPEDGQRASSRVVVLSEPHAPRHRPIASWRATRAGARRNAHSGRIDGTGVSRNQHELGRADRLAVRHHARSTGEAVAASDARRGDDRLPHRFCQC